MGGFQVDDINAGNLDSAGNRIVCVYSKVSGVYAVYSTDKRVMVHFADDSKLGIQQRLCLLPLHAMRGEIEELCAELLRQNDRRYGGLVEDIWRHMAGAFQIALQGQATTANLLLSRLQLRLTNQRASNSRLYYLLSTTLMALGLLVISMIAILLGSAACTNCNPNSYYWPWMAFAVGAVGAAFSVAIAAKSRLIQSAAVWYDNLIDAGLRVLIGGLSAVILINIFMLGMFKLSFGDVALDDKLTMSGVVLIGIVAGFFERLVPDMLQKFSPNAGLEAETEAPAAVGVAGVAANEQSPLGVGLASDIDGADNPVANPPEDKAGYDPAMEELEGCCDGPIDSDNEEAVTDDVELPEAIGGVEDDLDAKRGEQV